MGLVEGVTSSAADIVRRDGEAKGTAIQWTPGETMLVMGLLLLAFGLRLYQLGIVPPGLRVDEAHNGLDALRIIEGARPVFLEGNNGRDVLYSYIQAPLIALFGPTVWSLRLASVIVGTVTVPLTYLFVRSLPLRNRRATAAVATFLMATSLWHLQFSRFGVRGVTLPLVEVLTFLFLWRGLPSRRWGDVGLSGLALGLSLYTHPAARLLPLVPVTFLLYLAVTDRSRSREHLARLGLIAAVALIVFLPLGRYILEHPNSFFHHPVAVSILNPEVHQGQPVATILENGWKVARAFVWEGSRSWHSNLRGRPVFDPWISLFFLAGIGCLVWDLAIQRGSQAQQVALFLCLWIVVLALPTALTTGAPNYSRAMGLMPAIFIPPALALVGLVRWIAVRTGRPRLAWGIGAAVLAASALWTIYDYFVVYAQAPELHQAFGTAGVEKAALLQALAEEDRVYPSALLEQRSVLRYLTYGLDLTPLTLAEGIVVPADRPAWYAFAADEEADAAAAFAADWPSLTRRILTNAEGEPRWILFQAPDAPLPATTTHATFGGQVELLGYTLAPKTIRPGESPTLTLFWRAIGPLPKEYTLFVHILDQAGHRVGQQDKPPLGGSYPTSRWQPGDRIIDRFHPAIRADAPPGACTILVGWYDLATGERLSGVDGEGQPLPEAALRLDTPLHLEAPDGP